MDRIEFDFYDFILIILQISYAACIHVYSYNTNYCTLFVQLKVWTPLTPLFIPIIIRNEDCSNLVPKVFTFKYTQPQKKLYTLFPGEYSICRGSRTQMGLLRYPALGFRPLHIEYSSGNKVYSFFWSWVYLKNVAPGKFLWWLKL